MIERFILGENKRIKIKIVATDRKPFTITTASYELYFNEYTLEESGVCDVEQNLITTKINPKKNGVYTLIVTYVIGDETLKESLQIEVNRC